MGFRTNGISDQLDFGLMGFRTNGISDQWDFGIMRCPHLKLRQLCCRRWLSNKPDAVISPTKLAKSPDYSYYNILGQLCKQVLSQFVKGITEYSLTNFRSGALNLSKLACYFSYIPACVVVAMQRHQIIYYDVTYSQ